MKCVMGLVFVIVFFRTANLIDYLSKVEKTEFFT